MYRLILTIMCVLTLGSCKAQDKNVVYNGCHLLIYSPYGCYYDIEYNNSGKGVLKIVFLKDRLITEPSTADSVVSQNQFSIKLLSQRNQIDSIIAVIKKRGTVSNNYSHDVFRFVMHIDTTIVIDVYGEDGNINEFLKILSRSFNKDWIDKCGFFETFKAIK